MENSKKFNDYQKSALQWLQRIRSARVDQEVIAFTVKEDSTGYFVEMIYRNHPQWRGHPSRKSISKAYFGGMHSGVSHRFQMRVLSK